MLYRVADKDWSLLDDPSEYGNGRWKASTPIEILLWVGFQNRAQPGLAGMMFFYSMLVLLDFREKGKYRRVGIVKYEYLHAYDDREESKQVFPRACSYR